MTAEPASVTLHSTWRFLIGSAAGAGLVALAGTYGVASAGFNAITTILLLAGWSFVAVVMFDLPVASTFDSWGVVRRTLLWRRRLAWRSGDALTRARPSVVRQEARLRQGGLVLRRGRRRYLLVDRAESMDEFDAVVAAVDVPGTPGAEVDVSGLAAPPSATAPTWLYRRRRWRPDDGVGR